ncbi:MAG TPA: pyrroloquinoline quinone biosynthesis peptide chaperone PqqD [Geminicoccus sp.]|uniref:pyrroloquinoline quinone biosynthesis peptide chaperone PqqD n=1 Tax=Geminicoccus sp. TaxID=2024832 RepID=UPI002E375E2C|nr:pyrroloquinoline quinone biosynthesis peptide chaperone PqqD [Geminicoccus sp.]HEX2528803.1 pyrroloquinoline quinone biosynthesis peptide chaperone PqqD [Geminicoccus sp.]
MSDTIGPEARPRLPRGVRLRQDPARGAWLLLAPETLFELNQSSVEILKRCTGEKSLREIVDDLAVTFAVERERLERETTALIGQLHDKRLIDL